MPHLRTIVLEFRDIRLARQKPYDISTVTRNPAITCGFRRRRLPTVKSPVCRMRSQATRDPACRCFYSSCEHVVNARLRVGLGGKRLTTTCPQAPALGPSRKTAIGARQPGAPPPRDSKPIYASGKPGAVHFWAKGRRFEASESAFATLTLKMVGRL